MGPIEAINNPYRATHGIKKTKGVLTRQDLTIEIEIKRSGQDATGRNNTIETYRDYT